jgi:hypothetical protein
VVIETRHGLLVERLLDAGYVVLPVNPDMVASPRGPAGKKDDAEDARICCLLALDRHASLRPLIPHSQRLASSRGSRQASRGAVHDPAPMQAAMKGRDFRNFMETFLQYADAGLGKVFNYAWSGGTTIASIVALVLLFDDPGSTAFVLTAIGLGVWVVGILIVSNVWKTPTYKLILAGDPDDMPADWEATRQRYFNINWIQFATTWAAFALFLVALISLVPPPE